MANTRNISFSGESKEEITRESIQTLFSTEHAALDKNDKGYLEMNRPEETGINFYIGSVITNSAGAHISINMLAELFIDLEVHCFDADNKDYFYYAFENGKPIEKLYFQNPTRMII